MLSARITRVKLENYRSIRECDVELQPLTLLVGTNGSGKSNFLDSLRFLVHSLHSPLTDVLQSRFGIRSVLRKIPPGQMAPYFTIHVEFEVDGLKGLYRLTIGSTEDGAPVIQDEHCIFGSDFFRCANGATTQSTPTKPAIPLDRPALTSFGGLPQFAPVYNFIAGFTYYSPSPEEMRRPVNKGSGRILARDGSNAPDVFMRFKDHPALQERIQSYFRAFNAHLIAFTAAENEHHRWLLFRTSAPENRWWMNSSDMSDGTLRALAILLAIFQTEVAAPPPTLIGLEEPEMSLHPAAAGVLLDALLEASGQVQIVASTHSADLLDRKDFPAESILAVTMRDGETEIGAVAESSLAILRANLYTAGELIRSDQLHPAR